MKTETKKLAAKIADMIMTNGANEKAERLVLELPGKRDGGGWSRGPLIARIAEILTAMTPRIEDAEKEKL